MAHLARTADEIVARIARSQHGVVARVQLLAAGLSADMIRVRVKRGALIKIHRGVYRSGHAAPSLLAAFMAATLACGKGALLAGRSAAYLHRLTRPRPVCPDVICPTERRLSGVRTRHRRTFDPRDATRARGIPVLTVAATLVDLAALLNAEELAHACHEAGVRHKTTPRQVEAVLERRPNAPGAAKLRSILRGDTKVSLSRLERRFLSLIRTEGLPLPVTNKPAGGRRVDCRWPERRLTVELDSYTFHSSRHAWEADRRREREAYARGDQFRRFTWGDVFEEPRPMLGELRALLG